MVLLRLALSSGLIDVPSNTSDAIVKAAEEFRISFNDPLTYQNMSTTDCFNAFSNQYISERGDALLIQDEVVSWRFPQMWRPIWANGTRNYTWVHINASIYTNTAWLKENTS